MSRIVEMTSVTQRTTHIIAPKTTQFLNCTSGTRVIIHLSVCWLGLGNKTPRLSLEKHPGLGQNN